MASIRDRIAQWLSPPKPLSIVPAPKEAYRPLLQRALQVTEELEARRAEEQQATRDEVERRSAIVAEIEEAIALAHAPWQSNGAVRESRNAGVQGLIEAAKHIKDMPLRETIYGMAELEIAIEDRGWKRLIAQSQYEFSRFGIQSIMLICRLYYIKNPLARRGVDVSAFYVFGRGMEISSPDEDANETLKAFFEDPRNAAQFSHTAFVKKEKQTYTDGNVFWAFFGDPQDGRLESRCIDPLEMSEIICDPEDADTPWFYRRDWTEERYDPAYRMRTHQQRTQWYFALGYEDLPNFPANIREIEGKPVALDAHGAPIPVLHLKDGELPGWKFGCPRMYPAVDWLRAYKQVLEDLCTTWRALARFAWNVETKGGAPAIAAFKQTLATTLANDLTQIETNPPPVTGSAFISGPTNKITPIQAGGNTTMNPDNARRVLLMVCAAFGIGEHLMGDATTGSLATAASLERPTELMFLERQEVWREVVQRISRYALARSISAPKGKLREAIARRQGTDSASVDVSKVRFVEAGRKGGTRRGQSTAAGRISEQADKSSPGTTDITIEVKFPDILAHDIESRVKAIMEAMTLGGFSPVGIDQRVGIGLLLSELGVEDVESVLQAMFPESNYNSNRTIGPPPPNRIMDRGVGAANPSDNPNVPDTSTDTEDEDQATEAGISRNPLVIDKAVKALIEAARKNLEKRRSERRVA